MPSFFQMCESMKTKSGNDYWFSPPHDGVGLDIIKKGLEVRADRSDGETFWDDFIAVIGQNTEDAAKLLGVSRDRVSRWPQAIRKILDMVREQNAADDKKKKKTMLPTGG